MEVFKKTMWFGQRNVISLYQKPLGELLKKKSSSQEHLKNETIIKTSWSYC